jgi:hypothetical protein
MVFDTSTITKKVQYITIDSGFITSSNIRIGTYSLGGNNNFSVNFGTSIQNIVTTSEGAGGKVTTVTDISRYSSNIFIQEMKNVIGLKLVDFYVSQIASHNEDNEDINPLAVNYIDILCPNLPDPAQILDERKSRIFARIPLERDFSGSSNIVVNDKQWKSFTRQTNYFNPITIKQLNFQLWELNKSATVGDPGTYQPLQPDAQFYMVLEVTTIDNEAMTLPKEDPNMKIVEAIKSLESKILQLPFGGVTQERAASNKPLYIVIFIAVLIFMWLYFFRKPTVVQVQVPTVPVRA